MDFHSRKKCHRTVTYSNLTTEKNLIWNLLVLSFQTAYICKSSQGGRGGGGGGFHSLAKGPIKGYGRGYGKTGVLGEKPLGANSTQIWRQSGDFNQGQIGGRRVLSSLHYSLLPNCTEIRAQSRSALSTKLGYV